MPSWEFIQDMVLPKLLFMVLPALAAAALVMAAVERLGGARQAAAGAALALCVGAFFGLWVHGTVQSDSLETTLAAFTDEQTLEEALGAFGNALSLGQSTWNRLPWAILAALLIGRLAYLADVHASDGWLFRGGTAIAVAWLLLPEKERDAFIWMAPAFAAVIAALWIVLDRLATQPGSSSVAVCVILSLVVAGQLMLHAHSLTMMDTLAVLGFAFTGVAVIAYWRGVEFGGAIPAVAVALPALLLMGQRTTDSKLPWFTFALPACAPLLLAVTLPFTHWPKLGLHLLRLALVLAVLGATVAVAWHYEPLDFGGDGNE